MPSLRIVKYSDIVEDILLYLFMGAICFATNLLPLEELEEALGNAVIMATFAPAHALLQVVRAQKVAPIVANELTPLICMRHYRILELNGQRFDNRCSGACTFALG